MSKATTCKVCGAPRYELSEYRLCFTHYSEYRSKVSRAAYERTHGAVRRPSCLRFRKIVLY